MNILDHYGDNQPRATRVPEVVTPPPAVPAKVDALALFKEDPAALHDSALTILSIKVKPVETLEAASGLSDKLAQAKTLLKNIEARRKLIVEPIKRQAADVDAEARKWREPVEKFCADAERVLLAFRRKQADDAARAEAARQAAIVEETKKQGQAEILGNTAAIEAASTAVMHLEAQAPAEPLKGFKTEAGTSSVRKRWTISVVNAADVPPAYLVPDLKKLQAAVDAHPDPAALVIDGCHIEEVESLVTRTRG